MNKPNLQTIPHEPGCYLFLDKAKGVVYVGKAKDLRKRVSSYFSKKGHDAKTQAMLAQAHDIDFIVTNSEVEALILENNLIKKHAPKYNIDLKDAKRYAYLEIPDEPFPRLLVARKTTSKGKLFGPFTSGQNREYVRELLTKTFKIRTCNKLPKKACLRYHIGLCDAPCVGKQSEEAYLENVKAVEMILKGHTERLFTQLEKRMRNASNTQEYELAAKYRDQMLALKTLHEKQAMERQKTYDEDVLNYVVQGDHVYLMLFNVRQGILENKKEFDFPLSQDFLEEFLVQFYSEEPVPKEIILPEKVGSSIATYLSERKGTKVTLNIPQKGEKKTLLDLVKKNIELHFFGEQEKIEALQKALDLQKKPEVIECFDISHLGGTSTVASMVQFRNGKPDKSNYRRFKIKTVEGIDDFAAMGEVVRRRYYRLVQEKSPLPDLIVIDGGLGQLSYAMAELAALGVKVPVISLAKREEEIYIPGKKTPLSLSKKSKALHLLIAVRDEAHRFAITYQRLLRSKRFKK